jgi:DUF438 domain-containing protein
MSELIDNRQHRIRTMWGKDDEVRGLIKELGTALGESTATGVVEILEERT